MRFVHGDKNWVALLSLALILSNAAFFFLYATVVTLELTERGIRSPGDLPLSLRIYSFMAALVALRAGIGANQDTVTRRRGRKWLMSLSFIWPFLSLLLLFLLPGPPRAYRSFRASQAAC